MAAERGAEPVDTDLRSVSVHWRIKTSMRIPYSVADEEY